jgi:CubicO group peptidase (beta-lactamase class C family)
MNYENSRIVLFYLFMMSISGCDIYKSLRYGGIPQQSDAKHFRQNKIEHEGSTFQFKRNSPDNAFGEQIDLPDKQFKSTNITLNEFAKLHKTISFLIIRNDTILFERYNKGYTDTTLVSSFSLVKPIISTLIGIAIGEGLIADINTPIINYLPEFKNKPGWGLIKIKHLLHHTSGIKFSDGRFNPVSDNAEYYWGTHLREQMLHAQIQFPPDSVFHYSSINVMLLAYILEKVTGKSISNFLQEKLWKPLGMESAAYWSIDRKDSLSIEKAFCCLQARTTDFAKVARLYLNQGNWEGKQIIPAQWVYYSTHPDPNGHNKHFFNNNWGIGPLKYSSYFAAGLYGQFLYIYPEKNIIIVRFGDTDLSYNPNYWQNIFLQIIDQM